MSLGAAAGGGPRVPPSRIAWWAVGGIVVLAAVAYRVWSPAPIPVPRTITLYAYSAMEPALADGLLPAFQRRWQERTGERVEFVTTFAGSGVIAERVVSSIPVHVAVLASEIDAQRVAAGGAAPGAPWTRLPHGGVLARSPLMIVVRPGNPRGVTGLRDLSREGLGVVLPDPLTSGAGEWATLALHVALADATANDAASTDALAALWRNAIETPPSARETLARFVAGIGDATVAYEAQVASRGPAEAFEPVCPPVTVVAEAIATRVTRNITDEERPIVDALLEFLWTPEAQAILADHGFRPATELAGEPAAGCRPATAAITLAELGGADAARRRILEPLWRERGGLPAARGR